MSSDLRLELSLGLDLVLSKPLSSNRGSRQYFCLERGESAVSVNGNCSQLSSAEKTQKLVWFGWFGLFFLKAKLLTE